MKGLKKLIVFTLVSVLLLLCCACNKFPYADQVDRQEVTPPEIRAQAVYPEFPSEKPTCEVGAEPKVTGYFAAQTESRYTLTEEEDGVVIEYADPTDYTYIYAPVENYSPEYGNIKITFENLTPAAETVGIQAIYYEAKESGYPPVTVYVDSLVDDEQYLVSELGQCIITDAKYNKVTGESVRDKTIVGFVIFIDSLPSFEPKRDTIGKCKIKKFEFLRDDDERLKDRWVLPLASLSGAKADEGVTLGASEETLTASTDGEGAICLPVTRYNNGDFAEYTLSASGTGTAEIGVKYKLSGEKTERISTLTSVTLTEDTADIVYNFVKQYVDDEKDDIKTQYVRGGKITDIYIKLHASASITIDGVTFRRTVQEGAYATNNWNGCTGVEVQRVASGGNAKLTVEHFTGWYSSALSVREGKGVQKIVFTVYAPDGFNHVGVVVSTDSQLNNDAQPIGNYVVHSSWGKINATSYTFTAAQNLEGATEKIEYDKDTKIYTFTYDFTTMKKDSKGNTFADYTVNSLLFYFNDPNSLDPYGGTRNLYFLSIDLLTE